MPAYNPDLLKEGTTRSIEETFNTTVLMHLASKGKTEYIKQVLDLGANPLEKNERDETAADIAQRHGFNETAKVLRAAEKVQASSIAHRVKCILAPVLGKAA